MLIEAKDLLHAVEISMGWGPLDRRPAVSPARLGRHNGL
jgi:hypothetical protein